MSGSITGIAQLLTFALQSVGIVPKSVNLTGIFLLLVNIPLLILARSLSSKLFIYKTIATSICSSIAYTLIPVPPVSPIEDPLTACLIAGIIGGIASGLTLRGGGSGGGLDIIGLYLSHRNPKFSVGKVAIGVSLFVYIAAFFRFDFNITIYSIIFTVISSAVVDRVHYQISKSQHGLSQPTKDVKILSSMNLTAQLPPGRDKGYLARSKTTSISLSLPSTKLSECAGSLNRSTPPFVLISDSSELIGNFQFRIIKG